MDTPINKTELSAEGHEEDLHLENELLKLKMQAERGAVFGEFNEVPPEVENIFLNNIQKFEEMWEKGEKVKVVDFIGGPAYRKSIDVSDRDLQIELEWLLDILKENGMIVTSCENLDKRTMYDFITEEFFEYEIDDVRVPGMVQCFDYRAFHRDHRKLIEQVAHEFIFHWFNRSSANFRWDLCNEMLLPDGRILSQHDLYGKLEKVYASYISFKDDSYDYNDISFQMNEGGGFDGLGHAEGLIRYKAESEAGEIINIEGPFKIYMSYNGYGWNIFYFLFPGFVW